MRNSPSLLLISLAFIIGAQAGSAQQLRNGLGDASTIVTPLRMVGASGNPNEIGNFSNSGLGQDTGDFATRHVRSGNESGIGGSFLGTTNVTAESSPARVGRIPETAVRALIPTQGSTVGTTTPTYSETMTRPVSTALPQVVPNISDRWNASSPSLNNDYSSISYPFDFSSGHRHGHNLDRYLDNMGAPSFDAFH